MHEDFKYGLKDGQLIHINDVESGVKGCVCPSCENPFVAYKNGNFIPHFKHKANQGCKYSFETSLHYMAKEIIAEEKYLPVPDVKFIPPKHLSTLFPKKGFSHDNFIYRYFKNVKFDKVEVEKWEGSFKPDLKCYVGKSELLIEITVTHGIDTIKLQKIRDNSVPLLEIDLSVHEHQIDKEKLRHLLYKEFSSNNWRWVYNQKEEKKRAYLCREAGAFRDFIQKDAKRVKLYGKSELIYSCPIPRKERKLKPDAVEKFSNSCRSCDYRIANLADVDESFKFEHYVWCVGHRKKEIADYLYGSIIEKKSLN